MLPFFGEGEGIHMADWRCAKCNAENPERGNFCRMCGESRPKGRETETIRSTPQSAESPRRPGGGTGEVRSPLGRSLLDEIRSETSAALHQSRSHLEEFAAGMPKLSDLKLGMPDPGGALRSSRPGIQRVTTRDLQLRVLPQPKLNYALAHCGIPVIPVIEIKNNSIEEAKDVLIKAWVATDYGEPWQKTVPSIPAHKVYQETDILVPLTKSRLQEVREAEKANLRIDVFSEGDLQISETFPMEVLAYNEWFYHPHLQEIAACFVQPNSEAVENIVSMVRDRLKKEFNDTSLEGYQGGDPNRVMRMLEGLYLTLQKDLQLSYINPPPSFERPGQLPTGEICISQKVFFPEQILKHRRGTCLDLALLCASCVERMGLNPLFFLIQGHAFFGAWLIESNLEVSVYKDHALVMKLLDSNLIVALNSTTFASSQTKKFRDCVAEGRHYVSDPEKFWCGVDVSKARNKGFKPIPPLVD
jgi:hypothetical protein